MVADGSLREPSYFPSMAARTWPVSGYPSGIYFPDEDVSGWERAPL